MMKVAEYRCEIDAAFRIAHVHYQSCVNVKELKNWLDVAEIKLFNLSSISCKRAKPDDIYQYQNAIDSLIKYIDIAKNKIDSEELENRNLGKPRDNIIYLFN